MRACIYQETFVALMGNIDEFLIAAFLALASHGFTHHSAGRCAKGLRKVCEEVVRKRGAASRG